MHERIEKGLKLLCAILVALLAAYALRVALRPDPLRGLKIPEVPSLSGAPTNALPSATNAAPAVKRTNVVGTNAIGTNALGTNVVGTNAPGARAPGTNAATNAAAPPSGTNVRAGASGPRPGQPASAPPRELPPQAKARLDKIIDSELFGPVPRPVPAALIGIAGQSAMLRSTNGQEGLVKIGEETGGLKLLIIGTNRVLVEQNGQKSELMIFNGFGGESLLPKEKDSK